MNGFKNIFFSLLLAGGSLTAGFYLYQWLNPSPFSASESATLSESSQGFPKIRPLFSLPDPEGKLWNVQQWQGKVLVINFWATWCNPCRHEIPVFIELQKQYRDQGLQFLGIAIDRPEPVQKFYQKVGMNYPTLFGNNEAIEVGYQYGNKRGVLPFTAIIDRQNQIVSIHQGKLLRSVLEQQIQPLL